MVQTTAATRRSITNKSLPMFLSSTYHMIHRCDPDVATWSPQGDYVVIKNVKKFAADVLPTYFKHTNFSSFARQLNYYGFHKIKAGPAKAAPSDVRFFHVNFQRDKPELLSSIRRATQSDPQSKDDMDNVRSELKRLEELVQSMSTNYERRMIEMQYEYNRRLAALSDEHDQLAILVQQLMGASGMGATLAAAQTSLTDMSSLSTIAATIGLQNALRQPAVPFLMQNQGASVAAVAAAGQKRLAANSLTKPATDNEQGDGRDEKKEKKQRRK